MTQKMVNQKIKLTNEQMKQKMIDRAGARLYLELGPLIGDTIKSKMLAKLIFKDIEEEMERQNKCIADKEEIK